MNQCFVLKFNLLFTIFSQYFQRVVLQVDQTALSIIRKDVKNNNNDNIKNNKNKTSGQAKLQGDVHDIVQQTW